VGRDFTGFEVAFVVIPNGVRNLSGFEIKAKEGFLGARRAARL
jgi:hypothetical protein